MIFFYFYDYIIMINFAIILIDAPTIENGEEFCIRVCFSFFLFSRKISYHKSSLDRVE